MEAEHEIARSHEEVQEVMQALEELALSYDGKDTVIEGLQNEVQALTSEIDTLQVIGNIHIIIIVITIIINALTVQIPRHNTFLLLTLDTSCYPVGTHKHDRHLELHNANDTTLNKETTHSKAVINFKKLLKLLYNTSRMKQVLMLRYKSTKCSKHYEYTNGKKGSQFTT